MIREEGKAKGERNAEEDGMNCITLVPCSASHLFPMIETHTHFNIQSDVDLSEKGAVLSLAYLRSIRY